MSIANLIGRQARHIAAAIGITVLLSQAAHAQDVLKIGMVGAMTGGAAAWGLAAQTAAEMAAEKANAEGGLLVGGKRYKVEIVTYDDQYKASESISAYNRLRQQGVSYLYVLGTNGALALKDTFERDKVIAFTSGYGATLIDAKTNYLYRLYSTPINYGRPIIKYMKLQFPAGIAPKVAILNPNDETGVNLQDFQKVAYKDLGFNVVAVEAYERTLKDFQPMLTKVLAQKPDVIELGITAPATVGVIMRQARELGYKNRVVKMGGLGFKEVLEIAGPAASEGMIGVVQWDEKSPAFGAMAQEYQKRRGHLPNETMIAYYDSIAAMLAGIQASGTVGDAEKFSKAFPKVFPFKSMQGGSILLNGAKWYGADKQFDTPFILAQIKDGKAVPLTTLQSD